MWRDVWAFIAIFIGGLTAGAVFMRELIKFQIDLRNLEPNRSDIS